MDIIAVTLKDEKKRKDVLYGKNFPKHRLSERTIKIMRIKKENLFDAIMMLPDIKVDDPPGFRHVIYVEKENGDITIYRRSDKGLTELGKINGNENSLDKVKRDVIEAVMKSATEMGLTAKGQEKFLFDLKTMIN